MTRKKVDEVLKNTFRELDQVVEEQRNRKTGAVKVKRSKKGGDVAKDICEPSTNPRSGS